MTTIDIEQKSRGVTEGICEHPVMRSKVRPIIAEALREAHNEGTRQALRAAIERVEEERHAEDLGYKPRRNLDAIRQDLEEMERTA